MIIVLFIIFVMLGALFSNMDMFLLGVLPYQLLIMFKFMGLMFILMGMIIIIARVMQTGADAFIDLPAKNRTILIHSRRGKNPNATILKGKLLDLEFIKVKRKLFKDTGGGIRICGHDVRFTHETIAHDIPQWLGQYLHQLKTKYGVHNNHDLKALYEKLQLLRKPIPNILTLEEQLRKIRELDPIMNDSEARQKLLSMSYTDLQNMTEKVWDGKMVHMEDAEDFIESAPPNELDSFVTQEAAHTLMRIKRYRDPGEVNWGAWVGPAILLMVGGAIAVAIISGVFH